MNSELEGQQHYMAGVAAEAVRSGNQEIIRALGLLQSSLQKQITDLSKRVTEIENNLAMSRDYK